MNTAAFTVLKTGVDTLPKGDQTFARSLLDQFAEKGQLSDKQWRWVEKLADSIETAAVPDFTQELIPVGEFGSVIALFDKAKQYLKHPKILLKTASGTNLQLSLAGKQSKSPGTISITDGGAYGDSKWYGRVTKEGVWEPAKLAEGLKTDLTSILTQLAQKPAETAAAFGKTTGLCCFCLSKLSDMRSTEVGYGKVCAQRWRLPWGKKACDKEGA